MHQATESQWSFFPLAPLFLLVLHSHWRWSIHPLPPGMTHSHPTAFSSLCSSLCKVIKAQSDCHRLSQPLCSTKPVCPVKSRHGRGTLGLNQLFEQLSLLAAKPRSSSAWRHPYRATSPELHQALSMATHSCVWTPTINTFSGGKMVYLNVLISLRNVPFLRST